MHRSGTQLDDTDRAIIEQLQADGRIPYTRLGAAVGLSEAAVRQRVQRLIDAGVMQVVAVTNPLSLGLRRMAMIGVRTEGPSDDLAKALQAMDDIDYLVVTAGSFDLMCEVVVGDDADLLDLTNRIRSRAGVVSTETSSISISSSRPFTWGSPLAVEVGHDVLDAGVVVEAVRRQVLAVARLLVATVGHLGDERDVGVDPHATEVERASTCASPDRSPWSTPMRPSRTRRRWPNGVASSSSLNCCTVMTGPKISFWIISSSWCRPATTVGS